MNLLKTENEAQLKHLDMLRIENDGLDMAITEARRFVPNP